ncbi:MAG: zinc ribbon domain-containing protein [Deltaproteobacteria bacterium]|nr:zinc ribbon domain-containing protein [Deltaproteobacteria bacterium]
MPLFEYKCSNCNKIFEEFVRSEINVINVKCPYCGSRDFKKLMSTYAAFNSSLAKSDYYDDNFPSGSTGGCDNGNCAV